MDIVIRIKATGEVFNVPPRFALETKNTSPLFNDLGSKTISFSLPTTDHNRKLFSQATRLDIKNKPSAKIPVIVMKGSFMREGVLYLNSSINTERTFNCTIAYNEGIMYETMDDIYLTDLSNLPFIDNMPMDELIEYMNKLLVEDNLDADLSVFEIALKGEEYTISGTEYKDTYYPRINKADPDTKQLLIYETFEVVHNNSLETISVPMGYGISPFVKVWKILELIFGHFGYSIKENPFKDQFQLNRLCILNNTIDAIILGYIDYKQLLPKTTIKEFLQSLYCRFGLKIFFDGSTNEVELKLLKDIFNDKEALHITQSSKLDIEYTPPKQVKLSVSKSLDRSSTTTDTFEEFLAKFNNTIGNFHNNHASGVLYNIDTGVFEQISVSPTRPLIKDLSSIHFDWNKNTPETEAEEINSIDEAITMMIGEAVLYYGLAIRLANSTYSIKGNPQEGMNEESKLSFAYDMGELYSLNNGIKTYQGYKHGSIFPYVPIAQNSGGVYKEDKEGNQFKYALILIGEDGAFNRFFREYDAFLRHSNYTARFEYTSSEYNLFNIKSYKKWLVDGQPLLPDKIDYSMDNYSSRITSVETRTIRLYEPYDLDKDQEIPTPDRIEYQWSLYNTRDTAMGVYLEKRRDELSELNNVMHQFVSFEPDRLISDPNPPEELSFWFLPPTKEQYERTVIIGETSHTMRYRFKYVYRKRPDPISEWTTYTEYPQEDIAYKAWYEAVPI